MSKYHIDKFYVCRATEHFIAKYSGKIDIYIKEQKKFLRFLNKISIYMPIPFALTGVLVGKYPYSEMVFIFICIFYSLFVGLYLYVGNFSTLEEPTIIDLIEGKQALEEIELIKKEIALTSSIATYANDMPELVKSIRQITPEPNQREKTEFIIEIFYQMLDDVRLHGELITIAVYLHDQANDTLIDFCSIKNPIMNKANGEGRVWGLNNPKHAHSHVVTSFKSKEEFYIQGDIRVQIKDQDEYEIHKKDNDYYISAISIPIKDKTTEKNRGVLCITSNIKNRFGRKRITDEVTSLIQINQIKKNNFINITKYIETILNKSKKNNTYLISLIK